jgi:uncharacterized membrane protein YhaH (DUF805 family)
MGGRENRDYAIIAVAVCNTDIFQSDIFLICYIFLVWIPVFTGMTGKNRFGARVGGRRIVG